MAGVHPCRAEPGLQQHGAHSPPAALLHAQRRQQRVVHRLLCGDVHDGLGQANTGKLQRLAIICSESPLAAKRMAHEAGQDWRRRACSSIRRGVPRPRC